MFNQYKDKRFMEICAERTLQTNQQGFFLDIADGIRDLAGENWIKNVFGKSKNDQDRIKCIYKDGKIKDTIVEFLTNVQEVYRKKCADTSLKRRNEAEAILINETGDKIKALALYSQSILKSPENMLAVSLLGRSKVLIILGNNEEALRDLQQCLRDVPKKFKAEIYARISVCHKRLGQNRQAEIAAKLIEKLAIDNEELRELKNIIESTAEVENFHKKIKPIPNISGTGHTVFTNASSKIRIQQSKDLGRYAVANENISTGETLVVEPPYASCLLPEKFGTHCHHCYERFIAPIGCPECSSVAFCDSKCRDQAISTYHRYECKFLDLLIGSGMSILSHTALRMITQETLEKNLEIYRNKSRERIYKLCTNSKNRQPKDFLQRTLMAAFLLRCLQKAGYFGDNQESIIPNNDSHQYMIGEMLLFNLQMLQFNAHEIYETLYSPEDRFKGARPSYIGVAVYPTVALFNHDCYPGVTRYFVGKHIVINSIHPLRKGDLIAENYGPVFTWRNLAERQRSLSARYWFECRCLACLENWPSFKAGLESITKRVRCPTGTCTYSFSEKTKTPVKCPMCKIDVILDENLETLKFCEVQYDLGISLMESLQPTNAIPVLCGALDIFHKISNPPHGPTHLAQEVLRICLADSGNTCKCLIRNNDELNK